MISRRIRLDSTSDVGGALKKPKKRSTDDGPDRSSRGEHVRDLLEVVGSDLLEFGQLIIAGMKRTTGEGPPDTGALFGHGHDEFTNTAETLAAAVPDNRWDGAASHAYADQNTRQQVRAEILADADRTVQQLLVHEADQINRGRANLDDQSDFLAMTSYATFPLQFIPRYGEAAKLAIEGAALQTALGLSAYALYQLHQDAATNAARLQQTVGRYSGVRDGAEMPGATIDFTLPPPPSGGGSAPTPPTATGAGGGSMASGGSGSGGGAGAGTAGPLPQAPMISPQPNPPSAAASPVPTTAAPAPVGGAAPASIAGAVGGAVGALAGLIGPLTGLAVGAVLAGVQQGAEKADAANPEESDSDGREDEPEDDPKDDATRLDEPANEQVDGPAAGLGPSADAPAGDPNAGLAPVEGGLHTAPDGPRTPLTVKLNPDTSPGLSTGMSPHVTKLGEGVHVRG